MQSIFVKRSRLHHCHRLTSQLTTHTNTSLGQRSLTRRRGPRNSQEILGQLWAVVVPHRCHAIFHRTRQVLAPFVSSASAHLLLPNCAVWPPCSPQWFVDFLRCPAQVLQRIRCGFHRNISNWTTSFPAHEMSTWRSTLPKSALKTITPCFHVLAEMNWSASFWWTTFKKLGEHEWRNGDQKLNARVNVTSESARFPLWSGCSHRRSSTEAERTSAPSTNTFEIDVFCCSVDGSTRPVPCQITLCWTWNQSDVEEKCKCASPCTTLKLVKGTFRQMCLKPAQLKTALEGNVVALESYNMFEVR